jgi:hypothetical protein
MLDHLCTLLDCVVIEGVEPSALPSVHQQVTGLGPPVMGSCTPPRELPASHLDSVAQIDLPIGALNPHVELAQVTRHPIGPCPQIGNG